MKRWISVVSFALTICILFCACWRAGGDKTEPVQESRTTDALNGNDTGSIADKTEDDPVQPVEEDVPDAGENSKQAANEITEPESDDRNDSMTAPASTAPNADTTGDTPEDTQPGQSSNTVSENDFDEYELPEVWK